MKCDETPERTARRPMMTATSRVSFYIGREVWWGQLFDRQIRNE
jgi:hypothetical protein